MDILDSFGDWFQLIITIPVFLFLISFSNSLAIRIFKIGFPALIVNGYLLWINIYDYDIVIGIMIACVLGFFSTVSNANKPGENDVVNGGLLFNFIIAFGVMVTKIILFW